MRAPALRFALAGALLYALLDWSPPAAIPAPAAAASDDELLLDLALAAELDRSDPLVRDRLVSLGHFLTLAPGAEPDILEREARNVGLVRSDPIIRRHLVDLMRLTAAALPPGELPDERALREYYAAHQDAYALPERVRLTQVYLSRDARGAEVARQAAAASATLRAGGTVRGDPFARGQEIGPASNDELGRIFGPAFATEVAALPIGEWSAPIASAYGLHVVRVETRRPAGAPPYESVRGQLLHAWLRERSAERAAANLAGLRTP